MLASLCVSNFLFDRERCRGTKLEEIFLPRMHLLTNVHLLPIVCWDLVDDVSLLFRELEIVGETGK